MCLVFKTETKACAGLVCSFLFVFLVQVHPWRSGDKGGKKAVGSRLFIKAREKAGSLAPEDSVFRDSHNSLLA